MQEKKENEKIAILFPGMGYHCDKPLLYYSKKLAREKGYRIIELPYTNLTSVKNDRSAAIMEGFRNGLAQTEEMLAKENLPKDASILCISKSIGTMIAAAYQKKYGIKADNIYFTPLIESFAYIEEESGIAFHGTSDPWADTTLLKEYCKSKGIPLEISKKANHSLETGDALDDAKEMVGIIKVVKHYLKEGRGGADE